MACGLYHTVLLTTDGNAVAFGRDRERQCAVPRAEPGRQYVGAAAGDYHTVLLRDDGKAFAFGRNDSDGTQRGPCDVKNVEPDLPEGSRYVGVAAAAAHTILLRDDGEVVGLGDNSRGQLDVPPLPPGLRYTAVSTLVERFDVEHLSDFSAK